MADKDDDNSFDFLNDEEVDMIFDDIISAAQLELPEDDDEDYSKSIIPRGGGKSDVYLLDGTVLRFRGISSITLATVLATYGQVVLNDEGGRSAAIFLHGISAIIGSAE